MLKQGSFIKRKYYQIFFGSILGAVATALNLVLDCILSGSQLGETALTAVSIVTPMTLIIFFFSCLYAPGYGILYGKYNGEFDKENSYRTAGQMVVASAIVGVVLSLFLFLIKQPFLNYYGCTGELYNDASAYYNWKILEALLIPISNALYYLLAADADTLLLSVGGIAGIVSKIILSTLLCRSYGVAGLGISNGICILVYLAAYGAHWLRKTNSIHFILCFNVKEFLKAVKISGSTGCCYLFIALTDIIMNKVVLVACGINMVAAYSVINLIYGFYDSYCAPYSAAESFLASFAGEKNNYGIRKTMKTTAESVLYQGGIMILLLLIFAPQIPKIYGIESPDVYLESVKAVRLMTLAAIPFGMGYVVENLFPAFEKIRSGYLLTFLNELFCPLVLSIPFAYMFGFTGVSVGMAVNGFLVWGLFALISIKKHGKKDFPLYLENYGEESVSFDLKVEPESIIQIRNSVKEEFERRNFKVGKVELLIEELYKRIYEKNPGKTVLSECMLLFSEDQVRVIIRDDGKVFNYIDENNKIESINAYTLCCLLERVPYKEYILTTSLNRNGFLFSKD